MNASGGVDTSRTHWKWDKRKFKSAAVAMKKTQGELEKSERTDEQMRQVREDTAARAYQAEIRAVSEHEIMLSRLEDARRILRENDPGVVAVREAEVAAARARTESLAAVLPGTPEEIQRRLLERGAALEGSATTESHDDPK